MFDANASYIEKGVMFFAKICCIADDHILAYRGCKQGDVILCEMLTDDSDSPSVKVFTPSGETVTTEDDDFHTWIVYSGSVDGTGFLQQESDVRKRALEIIGEWK